MHRDTKHLHHNLPATNTFHNQRESTYSKHLTNFLPTYCFYVRAASTFQHLATNTPIQNSTHMLPTNNLLQSTFPQHHTHIAPIVAQQANEDILWGWEGYGLDIDRTWGTSWFCPHRLPTYYLSCHCTIAPAYCQFFALVFRIKWCQIKLAKNENHSSTFRQ